MKPPITNTRKRIKTISGLNVFFNIGILQKIYYILYTKELAMQFSHFNNGSLAMAYLSDLPRPYDLELFSTK